MRLPPLTLREALALHQRILESGGDILALAADPDDLALHLMASLVSFGAQLARDKDVITELMAENAALQASVEELNRLLMARLDGYLADQLEADPADQEEMARRYEASKVTGVEWRGPVKNYFDHSEEINKELAKGISGMARQNLDDSIEGVSDAIETTESVDKRTET